MPHRLDPFRAIVSIIDDSDVLVRAANAAGLQFDMTLTNRQDFSSLTRVRAFTPRVFAAYDALDDTERMVAAQAALASLGGVRGAAVTAMNNVGWAVEDNNQIAVSTPELREVFFPRGSQWDAFVVLRALFAEAATDILIVDAYRDGTVFMLATRNLDALRVRILCSRHATVVRAEATLFTGQHPGVTIEVRRTRDFHDRFVVLDRTTSIHIGTSLNTGGNTAFMISKVEDDGNRNSLLAQIQTSWDNGTAVP